MIRLRADDRRLTVEHRPCKNKIILTTSMSPRQPSSEAVVHRKKHSTKHSI